MFACRPDNYLQDMRAKIFPFKRREVKAFEVVPSVALPKKKKREQRERARDLQTSRVDDLVPQGCGQDDGESLGSQMFTAYSISLGASLDPSFPVYVNFLHLTVGFFLSASIKRTFNEFYLKPGSGKCF